MFRTHVRRRRRGVVGVAGILLAGSMAGPLVRAVAGSQPRPAAPPLTHVVVAGDTLWSIAVQAEPQADPRALVEAIEDANGVDAGALRPGMSLAIPAP